MTSRVINIDVNSSYISTIKSAIDTEYLFKETEHKQVKYLNNRIEYDHRKIKILMGYGLGFHSFRTGYKMIWCYKAMYMIRKGQVKD